MTRYWFGGGTADWTTRIGGDNAVFFAPGSELGTWNAQTGGAPYVDLLDAAGNPAATVFSGDGTTVPVGSISRFRATDGVLGLWIGLADGTGPRFFMASTDLPDLLAAGLVQAQAAAAQLANVGTLYEGADDPADSGTVQDGDVWFDTSTSTGLDPVAFVASSGVDNPGTTPDTTCPLPSGLAPGHVMLLTCSADVGGGINLSSGPSGWTQLIAPANIGTGDTFAGYWRKTYSAGDPAPVITLTGSKKCSAAIVAYSGADPTPHVIGTAGTRADGSNVNTTTAPQVTTTVDDCVTVSLFAEKSGNAASITNPSGTTRRAVRLPAYGSSSPSVLIVDADQPTAGATGDKVATYLTATSTAASSDNGRGLQVVLKRFGS